jgi:hypothetical protein
LDHREDSRKANSHLLAAGWNKQHCHFLHCGLAYSIFDTKSWQYSSVVSDPIHQGIPVVLPGNALGSLFQIHWVFGSCATKHCTTSFVRWNVEYDDTTAEKRISSITFFNIITLVVAVHLPVPVVHGDDGKMYCLERTGEGGSQITVYDTETGMIIATVAMLYNARTSNLTSSSSNKHLILVRDEGNSAGSSTTEFYTFGYGKRHSR